MEIDNNVCTDVQISKLIKNARESIVVETKTTTTTTTVTRQICIANDTNIDITDIQALLENKELPQTKETNYAMPPNLDVTENKTHDNLKRETDSSVFTKNSLPLLSSTKIETIVELGDTEADSLSRETFFQEKGKNNDRKKGTDKTKTKIMDSKKGKKRLKKTKSNDPKYIDGLINDYMTLEKKPHRSVKAKKEDKEPKNQPKCEQTLPQTKDLSAIFELSNEFCETPQRLKEILPKISPIVLMQTNDENFMDSSTTNAPLIKEEKNKSKRRCSKVTDSGNLESLNINMKQSRRGKKTSNIIETKKTSSMKKPMQSNHVDFSKPSPIKIYSPSIRRRLRTGTDNKLTLTKKMFEKKLEKHPLSSECMQRFGETNEIKIDANSRLLYYPQENIDLDKEMNKDVDILSVLQRRNKPLLVKETYID